MSYKGVNYGTISKDEEGILWKKNDVYARFAKGGPRSRGFAKIGGFHWSFLDSHNKLECSIKHILINTKLKEAMMQWHRAVGAEKLNSENEILKVINTGGPSIDFEDVSTEEKGILMASTEAWNSKNTLKCKLPVCFKKLKYTLLRCTG